MRRMCSAFFALVLILGMSSTTYADQWLDYDRDTIFASSEAKILIRLLSPPLLAPLLVVPRGPTRVDLGVPFDPGDGHWELPAEMVLMNLQGTHPMIGQVTLIESPTLVSSGVTRQQVAGHDFPAESFFDVFFEVQTAPMTLFNKTPLRMSALIDAIPPFDSTYRSADSVDLFDKANPDGPPVGRLLTAEHTLEVEPIPTLSEWGAIIFGTLLLGSVVFYIWRRRRVVAA